MANRGIAPVVGVALMIVITLLLASVLVVWAIDLGDLDDEDERIDELLQHPTTSSDSESAWDSDSVLIPVKAPGEAPRTSGEEVLEFRIENALDDDVTIESFAVDATGVDAGIVVNDSPSADEVEIRRVAQTGRANRGSDAFDADGTRYHLVDDSTEGGAVAVLDADEDDAEVDLREFSQAIGEVVFTDSEESADLIVYLILEDGSEHGFYFRQA